MRTSKTKEMLVEKREAGSSQEDIEDWEKRLATKLQNLLAIQCVFIEEGTYLVLDDVEPTLRTLEDLIGDALDVTVNRDAFPDVNNLEGGWPKGVEQTFQCLVQMQYDAFSARLDRLYLQALKQDRSPALMALSQAKTDGEQRAVYENFFPELDLLSYYSPKASTNRLLEKISNIGLALSTDPRNRARLLAEYNETTRNSAAPNDAPVTAQPATSKQNIQKRTR